MTSRGSQKWRCNRCFTHTPARIITSATKLKALVCNPLSEAGLHSEGSNNAFKNQIGILGLQQTWITLDVFSGASTKAVTFSPVSVCWLSGWFVCRITQKLQNWFPWHLMAGRISAQKWPQMLLVWIWISQGITVKEVQEYLGVKFDVVLNRYMVVVDLNWFYLKIQNVRSDHLLK